LSIAEAAYVPEAGTTDRRWQRARPAGIIEYEPLRMRFQVSKALDARLATVARARCTTKSALDA
jgi:hypothetical protein